MHFTAQSLQQAAVLKAAARLQRQYMIFMTGQFMDTRVVESMEESISKTNDHTARSISTQPYGKSFRGIITLLVICFYLSHLSHPVRNVAWLTNTVSTQQRKTEKPLPLQIQVFTQHSNLTISAKTRLY